MSPMYGGRSPQQPVPNFADASRAKTFSEAAHSFHRLNSAAKRHSHMSFAQQTRFPDRACTIHDKVALREGERKSPGGVPGAALTPRHLGLTPRSRTPSPPPWYRRPRSLPATPRSSGNGPPHAWAAASQRSYGSAAPNTPRAGSRSVAVADYAGGMMTAAETPRSFHAVPVDAARMRGTSPFRVGDVASFEAVSPGRSVSSRGYVAAATARAAAAAAASQGMVSQLPGRGPPSLSRGDYIPASASTAPAPAAVDGVAAGNGHPGHPSMTPGPAVTACFGSSRPAGVAACPRSASFVRLNSFLLRTHITSLISALSEDGWFEAWEKERLCRQAREDSHPWASSFLRIYSRFVETEDVHAFVADLRAQALHS
eukprot:TRINITY_DN51537_c0_g1_i1.p1 TRINITY_DN51537_c0_g1~~TRINITY_DN51537_c0_g1_i1.p1  ORF type:complete len:371 (+),score=48.96 TRINITY_DN51537_c0_g1_i1:88-1200(+)